MQLISKFSTFCFLSILHVTLTGLESGLDIMLNVILGVFVRVFPERLTFDLVDGIKRLPSTMLVGLSQPTEA